MDIMHNGRIRRLADTIACNETRRVGLGRTVGRNDIGFTLEQMCSFVGGDLRNGSERVCCVGRGTLDAVAMVDATVPRFPAQRT